MSNPVRTGCHVACSAVLALIVACSGGEPPGTGAASVADQARATQLLADYEAARSEQRWEQAEAYASTMQDDHAGSEAAQAAASTVQQVQERAEEAREARRLRDLWDYQAVAAGKGVQRSATIASRTVQVGEGEMALAPDAQLVLRDHPSWGRSVYLLLAQKRFDCGSPCAMQIAFDDGEPARHAGKQADSGQGPALFIVDDARFLAAMADAKTVSITLPKGSGTIPKLRFEVGGYDPARFEKP